MTNEESVLEEAIANLREAAQRIRATQNLMHSRGMTEEVNYRELLTRLSTALALTEAALMWRLRGGAACSRLVNKGKREGPRLLCVPALSTLSMYVECVPFTSLW